MTVGCLQQDEAPVPQDARHGAGEQPSEQLGLHRDPVVGPDLQDPTPSEREPKGRRDCEPEAGAHSMLVQREKERAVSTTEGCGKLRLGGVADGEHEL